MSIEIPGFTHVVIPDNITVHLGPPNEKAENITISFIDYIKNVASSELYPTWPESSLRANIHAIVSVALNRIFTEWYRTQGYTFDITSSTAYDQAFVFERGIFDNISAIVNDIFDEYIVREGRIEPLFAQFCDGRISQCDGMYQWGSVDLADKGYTTIDILKYYYGDDVTIMSIAAVGSNIETFPGNLKFGDIGPHVQIAQIMLNRISENFPAITVQTVDSYFGPFMESIVIKFQQIFNLPVTGIIDKGTWYELRQIYNAVNKLAELASTGVYIKNIPEDVSTHTSTYIQIIQYFLNVISAYYPTVFAVDINGVLNPQTNQAIIEFQKTMKLPETGLIDEKTWETLYSTVLGILNVLPPSAIFLPKLVYPEPGIGRELGRDAFVYILKLYLSYISTKIPAIAPVVLNDLYDTKTEEEVKAFQKYYGLPVTGRVNEETWNKIIQVYRQLRFGENS
ncbi:MAG: putative peptidoglycan-binding protein [Bacillota bacterium]|nr:putative peptidoglycan-binding protein [Bacillota bacterium]